MILQYADLLGVACESVIEWYAKEIKKSLQYARRYKKYFIVADRKYRVTMKWRN